MRMGGLRLRPTSRCARAACWASWSDALHMIHQRTPAMAELVVEAVCQEERPGARCLGELQDAAAQLEREGFWWRASWEALRGGERPPLIDAGEPGEWPHGWQFWASSVSDTCFRNALLSHRTAARQAHLWSHSGRNAGADLAFSLNRCRTHRRSPPVSSARARAVALATPNHGGSPHTVAAIHWTLTATTRRHV